MTDRGHTNGAESSEGGARFPQHLTETGRQIRGDAQNLVSHVSEAGTELQSYVTDMVRERPLATLGVAAGIGFLLGGGLTTRLTVLALGAGTRFAFALAAREMSAAFLPANSGDRQQQQLRGPQDRGQSTGKEQNKESRGNNPSSTGGSSQTH
jgi:ElaB/YqjD/DUF883 family membrane-anchored ribosome-binding protein